MESNMPVNKPQLTAVVGVNWGDEGKGRMVDLLTEDYDVVVRYQGGNNAGHTVVNDRGKFILNLLPSGILNEDTVNVMGPGMVIDLEHLVHEIDRLRAAGIEISPKNLKISDRAVICLPYHVRQDIMEEERLGEKGYGSTRRGIAPVYADKYMKKALKMGDLLYPDSLEEKVDGLCKWKSLTLEGGYNDRSSDPRGVLLWLNKWGDQIKPYICDTSVFLEQQLEEGKRILFEAQLGALRDIDYGIYPFTSSSSTLAAYAPVGSGLPGRKIERTLGVIKAYSTCVGAGPFVAECDDEWAESLRSIGAEYGAATGRPRRVGPFDIPASRYGAKVQGADELALTKLDVLTGMEEIPVCVEYELEDGTRTRDFPMGDALNTAKPVIEKLPGWNENVVSVRKFEDLPENAQKYVRFIESNVGVPVRFVSVGPERGALVEIRERDAQ